MLQKSIITTRALMLLLTILSIGMMFIATSSVFAASSNRVHLSIVRAQSSDRGCVRIRNGKFRRDVTIPEKGKEYDAGMYHVGMTLKIEIHNGGRCEDPALSTTSLTLQEGTIQPSNGIYEAVFTVDQ
jgi:hypothetical protein